MSSLSMLDTVSFISLPLDLRVDFGAAAPAPYCRHLPLPHTHQGPGMLRRPPCWWCLLPRVGLQGLCGGKVNGWVSKSSGLCPGRCSYSETGWSLSSGCLLLGRLGTGGFPHPPGKGGEVTPGPSSADHAQGRPGDQMRAERDFPDSALRLMTQG